MTTRKPTGLRLGILPENKPLSERKDPSVHRLQHVAPNPFISAKEISVSGVRLHSLHNGKLRTSLQLVYMPAYPGNL